MARHKPIQPAIKTARIIAQHVDSSPAGHRPSALLYGNINGHPHTASGTPMLGMRCTWRNNRQWSLIWLQRIPNLIVYDKVFVFRIQMYPRPCLPAVD